MPLVVFWHRKIQREDLNSNLIFSSTLDDAQRKYSTGEKEAWAIVAAVRKFGKYLHTAGRVIIISVDVAPPAEGPTREVYSMAFGT